VGLKPKRIRILGVPLDAVDMAQALDYVDHLIATGQQGAVIAVNPEKVMKAREDPWLLEQLRSAALLVPDGIGVVWAARLLGLARLERVAGSDLMPNLCALAARRGYGVFLYGARPEVNAGARQVLEARYPGLRVVGNRDGYVPEQEMSALVEEINRSRADLLFVALGSPRQEAWMATQLPKLDVKICQGVGGTLDVLTGHVPRAPKAWQAVNLEWAYRLLREPRRLLRQTALPKFAWAVLAAKTGSNARQNGSPPA